MEIATEIEISFDNNISEILLTSLKPETLRSPSERSRSKILRKDSNTIIIKIEANDLVSLRAAINSYFRWLIGIFNCLEVIDEWRRKKK